MLMEREYGPHIMRRFLKYELDNYLSSRGGEAIEELPLYRVENQGYIHYRKGSIVMYALKDYMGQQAVDAALRNFVAEAAYKTDPYPRSRDLIRHLRDQATTDEQHSSASRYGT
jgi:aminopeptidase N